MRVLSGISRGNEQSERREVRGYGSVAMDQSINSLDYGKRLARKTGLGFLLKKIVWGGNSRQVGDTRTADAKNSTGMEIGS